MRLTPVLSQEDYVEQAYFFQMLRERLLEGLAAQEILAHLADELLSATKLPMAVQFLFGEIKHHGQMGPAMEKIPHYFTPFQAHVMTQAESDNARFAFEQALLLLEREARYRAGTPTPAGLFVYQLEAVSRNRLGYVAALTSMERDGFYDEHWRGFFRQVRANLGIHELADLILARSEHYVSLRRKSDPQYQPSMQVLFQEKEGRIAAANMGKDPMYLFATLQRQLNYPEVPRPPKADERKQVLADLLRTVDNLQERVRNLEAEARGTFDLSRYYVKEEKITPEAKNTGGETKKATGKAPTPPIFRDEDDS